MREKILILIFCIAALSGFISAQETCQVLGAQDAEGANGEMIEPGDTLQYNQEIATGEAGGLSLLCGETAVEVGPSQEGIISEIGDAENLDVEVEPNASQVEVGLKNVERIEENLNEVNQMIDEQVPKPLQSLILGDRVNFAIDNTTVGIKSNNSAITDLEEGGIENPTLEITMKEDTMKNILNSNNTLEKFSQAYEGDEIQVKAHSWRNKIVFGAVELSNKIYGFFF